MRNALRIVQHCICVGHPGARALPTPAHTPEAHSGDIIVS
jgi:hypothetical protein